MRDSYRVVPALPGHVSVLPSIERLAAELFEDVVPAELLEHVTDEAALLDSPAERHAVGGSRTR